MVPSLLKITEGREVLDFLDDEVRENILQADYSDVVAEVASLESEAKVSLLTVCVSSLIGPQSIESEAASIAAVRVLVALLPLSLGAITNLLNRFQNWDNYEVHFTLFCYLDWVQKMPDAPSLTRKILPLVENYLMTVPRKDARAVWMAGDMLGGHWDEQEAIPLLIRTSQGAKYSVGRMGGLVGLKEVLDRLPPKSDAHKDILKTLRKISISDSSKYVKEDAKLLLRHWRKLEKMTQVLPDDDVS